MESKGKEVNKTIIQFEDVKINVKVKLAGLWATLMFLYIYADIVAFYSSEHIEGVLAGEVAGIQLTQIFMLGVIILMAIPSFMVFLSLILKAKANRWVNIILGILHAGLALFVAFIGDLVPFGIVVTILEVAVLSLIVCYAWKWPKKEE